MHFVQALHMQRWLHQLSTSVDDLAFINNTPASVTLAPVNCNGVSVSFNTAKPASVANIGVKNVRLDSFVRLPLLALKKNTP